MRTKTTQETYDHLCNMLDNFDWLRKYLVDNMKRRYVEEYEYSKIALHLYDVFSKLNEVKLESN